MEWMQGCHKAKNKMRETKNSPFPYLHLNQLTKSTLNMDKSSKSPLIHSEKSFIRKRFKFLNW